MVDVFDKHKRSEVMSRIRSKNTKPEMLVRKFLHSKGLRFRLHSNKLPGKPDLVLPKHKTAIFVHGCFWHGHEDPTCKIARVPKSNTEFWTSKITYNQNRHAKNVLKIKGLGWKVITVWECKLRSKDKLQYLNDLVHKITSQD